jgi:hypothetical protein
MREEGANEGTKEGIGVMGQRPGVAVVAPVDRYGRHGRPAWERYRSDQ